MLTGNGRHRRPRQAPALLVAAGVTGSAIAIPLLGATGASAADGNTWDQVAKCETNSVAPSGGEPGNFLSAGGHFQAEGHSGHPASGDLTSVQVLEDGTATLVTTTDAFTVDELVANGGTSVMIHAGADNFGNIPTRYAPAPDQQTLDTGDAGGRVACGVITKS